MTALNFIYMDNYRGFKHQLCPIATVNFLVGENSTGKSSLLSAFSFLVDFPSSMSAANDASRQLGSFQDNVSSASEDAKQFKIGWAQIQKSVQDDGYFVLCGCYKMQNKKGIPSVAAYAEKDQNIEIAVAIPGAKYRVDTSLNSFSSISEAKSCIFSFFESCGGAEEKRGFKKFPSSTKISPAKAPLQLTLMFIRFLAADGKDDDGILAPSGTPFGVRKVKSFSPIRSAPQKYYDVESIRNRDESLSSYLELRKLTETKKSSAKAQLRKLEEFGSKSGLFDSIKTKTIGSRSATSPFEVSIGYDNASLANIKNVGYGVSQVLPLLMDCINPKDGVGYLIQQPEVHLHPRAQAAFGDLIFDSMSTRDGICMIETHSDFLIDHFRLSKKRSSKSEGDCCLLFFERNNGFNEIAPMVINDQGLYPDDQPEGFRDFFIDEAIMGLELS